MAQKRTNATSARHRRDDSGFDSASPRRRARAEAEVEASHHYQSHKSNFITRLAIHWWNRILGAVGEGSFSDQEEQYESHRTTRDYIWNSIGVGTWGGVFPLLTIVVTQLVGVELAGMFSLAFVTGMLLMILANYGVRTYQVSDLDEKHTFLDYQLNRVITCVAMLVIGIVYCTLRGYGNDMLTISIGVYIYKMIDGWADVYEGRLQQCDKLYLAGISQTVRSVLTFIIFTIVLAVSRNLAAASIAMAIVSTITMIIVTIPLALFETPRERRWSIHSISVLFQECFPLLIALFLYAFIDNMPKFVMEGVLTYDNQLYFNAIYFPAQMILIVVQLVYKPLLVRLANIWADPKKHKQFDQVLFSMIAIIVVITLIMVLFMGWIGIPIVSFLYGVDFEQFRVLVYLMLVAGGITAAIDFLYQVITVLRRQRDVVRLYLIVFVVAIVISLILINLIGLTGAVIEYLSTMTLLFVLLIIEYVSIRHKFEKNPEGESAQFVADGGLNSTMPGKTMAGPVVKSTARGKDLALDAKVASEHRRRSYRAAHPFSERQAEERSRLEPDEQEQQAKDDAELDPEDFK